MNYVFGKERVSLKKEGLTSEKIKDFTLNLCDEDYNGSNGYDYFKEISTFKIQFKYYRKQK